MEKSKILKHIKLVLFYLMYLVILILIFEFILFGWSIHSQRRMFKTWGPKKQVSKYFNKSEYEMSEFTPTRFRKDAGISYDKKSILIFGCSHLYGAGLLKNEQTFSYKLSQATHRPVYNRAYWGWAPSHMLYILQNQEWIESIKEPEYIITMFMPDYEERFYFHQGWPYDSGKYLRYELDKNGELKLIPTKDYPWYWRTLIVKYVQYCLEKQRKNKNYTNKLYVKIMQENMKIIRERYPDTKVIILLYQGRWGLKKDDLPMFSTKDYFDSSPFYPETLTQLEKIGYIIVNMEELVHHTLETRKYKLKGDPTHPNEQVWDEFVPILKKKFDM